MKCTCTCALLSVKGLSAAKHASHMVLHETWRVTLMFEQIVTLTSYLQTTNPRVHLLHHFPPADQNNGCKEGFHPALSFTKKYQRWTRRVHKSSIMYQTSRCSASWQRQQSKQWTEVCYRTIALWQDLEVDASSCVLPASSGVAMADEILTLYTWNCAAYSWRVTKSRYCKRYKMPSSSRQCCSWSCQTATEKPDIPGRQRYTLLACYCLLIKSIEAAKALTSCNNLNQDQSPLQLPTRPATNATLDLHPTEPCPACWIAQSCDWSFIFNRMGTFASSPHTSVTNLINSIFAIHKCYAKRLEFQKRWKMSPRLTCLLRCASLGKTKLRSSAL